VVKKPIAGRPRDVVSQPPGGRPTLNLQLSSRRLGWGSAALGLLAAKPAVWMVEAPSSFFTTEPANNFIVFYSGSG